MGSVLAFASSLVSLALALARMVETRKVEASAQAALMATSLQGVLDDLDKANKARLGQRAHDAAGGLRDTDGFRRDG